MICACERILDERRREMLRNPALKPTDPRSLESANNLVRIATDKGFTSGKWLLLVQPRHMEAVWRIISKATEKGDLGFASKKKLGPKVHNMLSICVYIRDFTDHSELRRVLLKLKELLPKDTGPPVVFAGFKPDVFTALGLYGGNQWKLEVTIHKEMCK